MFASLGFKSDYSLLKSLIKISDLKNILNNSLISIGLIDDNLFGSMEFYKFCISNNIKPVIGLEININEQIIYLYAKDFKGYQNLLIINSIKQKRNVNISDIKLNSFNIKIVLPFESKELIKEFSENVYLSYRNEYEKKNELLLTEKIVFINKTITLKEEDLKYIKYLYLISSGKTILEDNLEINDNFSFEYYKNMSDFDKQTTIDFIKDINIEFDFTKKYIPVFNEKQNSKEYLYALCKMGLNKRLNNNVNKIYLDRLKKELEVIFQMKFEDYFLIVYDYVKYAKNNGILVGPGRGSAAGSLVSYCLGITEIDPIKYNLVFERFLNKDRVTMPDIDIDFEYTRRDEVIKYVKEKYHEDNVALIITFNNLKEKQVIRDVARTLNINIEIVDKLSNLIDIKKPYLKDNLKNKDFVNFIKFNKLEELLKISLKLEGLKRHISTHAAGVVISSQRLEKLIPLAFNNDIQMTGFTMNYLEELGLLKMDFLSLKNLTLINNIVKDIEKEKGIKISLNNIPLNDKDTLNLFYKADTLGIFQFESNGMKNFLNKLKVTSFNDLIAAIALFRPGPMENIDTFINRKHGKEKITYLTKELEEILKETYGIIIYQEQIIEILRKIGDYSFSKADNIRKAMSKKKIDIMEKEREIFIKSAIENGCQKNIAEKLYNLIIKFASYGFNKSHSVSYALVGYQMAYLKAHYKEIFIANLLNNVISSEIKTKEYLEEAKRLNIDIIKPDINISKNVYITKENKLILPLNIIKNIGDSAVIKILEEREKGKFLDYFDFIARCYGKSINKKTIESLILAGALDCFRINKNTMLNNLNKGIMFAELAQTVDSSLLEKPFIEEFSELDEVTINRSEKELFGFYLSNHPTIKYNQVGIIKVKDLKNNFDHFIKNIVLIESIRKIKTKNNEEMAFVKASDDTGVFEYVIFPKILKNYSNLKVGDICLIYGKVTKRFDKYQVNISNITIK